MDPFTIILIVLFALASGGVGRQALKRSRHRRREELREALLQKLPGPDRYVSLFDIFWDLGVSDYALVIMGHQDLLPEQADDLDTIFNRLDDRIQAHGSYDAFIDDVLEAIQEFYEEHRAAGARRQLPHLESRTQKLVALPGAQGAASSAPEDDLPEGYLLDIELDERARVRTSRAAADMALVPSEHHASVDIDELARASPMDVLKGVLHGNFTARLTQWIEMRELRGLREELDARLTALYHYLEQMARQQPDFFEPLYDLTRRWEREARRIEQLEERRPWAERPWAQASDLLVEEARILARYLARHARKNTDEAIDAIRQSARAGDEAMAGYLVYANRYAFFAGRGDGHAMLVVEIENAIERIQAEVRALREKHVI